MVAHLDSVTSLAVDQHGLYLISGSHDCSIRCLARETIVGLCLISTALCLQITFQVVEP